MGFSQLVPGHGAAGMSVATLVFDLDGTISDSSPGIIRSFNHALGVHGFETAPEAAIAAEIGPQIDKTFLKLADGLDPAHVPEMVTTYRARYATTGYAENTLYPGIYDAITGLATSGVTLGVCTSKREDLAIKVLDHFGLLACFAFVSGGDVGIRKQDQLRDLLAAGRVAPDAWMVGDRDIDIASAKANGLRSLGVRWGFGAPGELERAGADRVAADVGEMLNIVAEA